MRCDNCGWSNPEGLTKCQKCNQELTPPVSVAPAPSPASSNPMNQTVIDPSRHGGAQQQSSASCDKCGYPLSSLSAFCPNCGAQLKKEDPEPSRAYASTVRVLPDSFMDQAPVQAPAAPVVPKATVREIPAELLNGGAYSKTVRVLPEEMLAEEEPAQPAEPSFRLTPMDNFDGASTGVKEYTGASASVGRDALVSDGAYIPEGLDVEFTCEDGQWSVVEKSGLKAVYVSAGHPVKIQPGDVIVIGNRRYLFE